MLYPSQKGSPKGTVDIPVTLYVELLKKNILDAQNEIQRLKPKMEQDPYDIFVKNDWLTVLTLCDRMTTRLNRTVLMVPSGTVRIEIVTADYLEVNFMKYPPLYDEI